MPLKCIWIGDWLMALCPGFTKVSVILLYRRIFLPNKVKRPILKVLLWITMVISVAWTIAIFVANICEYFSSL